MIKTALHACTLCISVKGNHAKGPVATVGTCFMHVRTITHLGRSDMHKASPYDFWAWIYTYQNPRPPDTREEGLGFYVEGSEALYTQEQLEMMARLTAEYTLQLIGDQQKKLKDIQV